MKKVNFLIICVFVCLSVSAQKNELKKIEKLIKGSKFSEASESLKGLEELSSGTKYESYYYFLEGKSAFGNKKKHNYPKASKNFYKTIEVEVRTGSKKYSEKSISYINTITNNSYKSINKLLKEENYEETRNTYKTLHEIYPERKDVLENLLYCHLKLKDYPQAANVIEKLLESVGDTIYTSVSKSTSKSNDFFTKKARDREIDLGVDLGLIDKETEKSVRLGYFTDLSSIYAQQEKLEKEISVLENAKKEYPDHAPFYESYSTAIYKTGDKEAYLLALEETLGLTPDKVDLWYNLGVISQGLDKLEKSVMAYDKVIELDPSYRNAYINKGLILLKNEKKLVKELNKSVGTKKYGIIKNQIQETYLDVIPLFEEAYNLKKDEELKLNLKGLYNAVGYSEKAKSL